MQQQNNLAGEQALAYAAMVPAVTRHIDELDAQTLGERFLRSQAEKYRHLGVRRVGQPDDGAAALPVKMASLMDKDDRILAFYVLNRDRMNWTRLTLVTPEIES